MSSYLKSFENHPSFIIIWIIQLSYIFEHAMTVPGGGGGGGGGGLFSRHWWAQLVLHWHASFDTITFFIVFWIKILFWHNHSSALRMMLTSVCVSILTIVLFVGEYPSVDIVKGKLIQFSTKWKLLCKYFQVHCFQIIMYCISIWYLILFKCILCVEKKFRVVTSAARLSICDAADITPTKIVNLLP